MAPPKTRRPGFSRRAQYGLFIGYVVAVGGVMLALLLLAVRIFDPQGFAALRGLALDMTTPISAGGRSVVRGVTGSGDAISNYFMAASRNAELNRRLEGAEQELIEARAIRYENMRLKRLLKLTGELNDEVTTARIVNSSFDSSRRLATITAGSSDGVRTGQPVRAPEGLIGRIIEVGRFASRVLLITDGASNVPVRAVRNGIPAMATGRGDGTLDIKPLEVGQNPFRQGDIFVTSGIGGIFGPNIPAAIVVRVTREETLARPLANPARADFAIVQNIYMAEADAPLEGGATPPSDALQAPPPPPPGTGNQAAPKR
ncbi:MAG TPA: rod shape-determining protein MreC [Allosphingosinicella sp.]|uniref:rod shape-determining protein MreC n=1 Tax=Allosphingosinicella sp. TaxID=2823234 RepID=UPI002ED9C1C2